MATRVPSASDLTRFPGSPCLHRGNVIGTEPGLQGDRGTEQLPVYECRLHGACTARRCLNNRELPSCAECKDRDKPFTNRERPVPQHAARDAYDVDVFMPYYSSLQYVPAAIDSILWQKNVNVLLHLVNDCSEEDDQFLFEQYGHLPNIRWYKTVENVGPYVIANALFYFMESDCLAMMGSDDIALPNRLAHSLQQLNIHNSEIHSAGMENFLNPVEQHQAYNIEFVKRIPVYRSSASKNGILVNGAMVVRKATFQKMNGYDGSAFCGGDTEFDRRAKCADINISTSHAIVGLRRVHGQSLARGTGEWGITSAKRKSISDRWKKRFREWNRQPGFINPAKWGTLSKTARTVLEKIQPQRI